MVSEAIIAKSDPLLSISVSIKATLFDGCKNYSSANPNPPMRES
jgi:hypothetical protein